MPRLIMTICIIAGLSSCSDPGRRSCAPGFGSPHTVFTLFFGEAIPGRGDLTDQEWQTFLATTVTANLPNGYTVFDAAGGWRNPVSQKTISEHTKVLLVALPASGEDSAPIDRIRTAYQTEFHQQLVGMTVEQACGSF